jgi:hypothetical protein
VGAAAEIGKRLKSSLGYSDRTETTVLLEEPEALNAETVQEDKAMAKTEAERSRPGLTMLTDRSRLVTGAAWYVVAWVGIKTQLGYNLEAYDALARALEVAARRQTTPERVTVFTDAHAAIRRMAFEGPGPGKTYAIQARRHTATLRRARLGVIIEFWWCPVHKGVPGNEKADEWAKLAAEEPDAHGVQCLQGGARPIHLPRSLALLKWEISENKWAEARRCDGGRVATKKYKMPRGQRPDKTSPQGSTR